MTPLGDLRRLFGIMVLLGVEVLLVACVGSPPDGAGPKPESSTSASAISSVGSSAETTGTQPVSLRVVEAGQSPNELQHDQLWTWAVIFDNPNPASAALDVDLRVAFLDREGRTLDVHTERIPLVLPGRMAWAQEQFEESFNGSTWNIGDVHRLDASFEVGAWVPFDSAAGAFRVSNVKIVKAADPARGDRVVGEVLSSFPFDQKDVSTVAVFRGSDGKILGGERRSLPRVPARGSALAEVRIVSSVWTSYNVVVGSELFASPSSNSEI